jgi:hypothetical protein
MLPVWKSFLPLRVGQCRCRCVHFETSSIRIVQSPCLVSTPSGTEFQVTLAATALRRNGRSYASGVLSAHHLVRDLVPLGHDQRRFALLVHAAEPTGVKKRLTPLPVSDAVGLAYLHRHAAARAGVAIAGNHNWLSSFHTPSIFDARRFFSLMNDWDGAHGSTSLAHAQTSRCACCGTRGPIGCTRRTDYRDQHLIFITTDSFFAAYDPEACDARRTGRSHWAGRTLIAFWSHWSSRPGVSFFARHSRLTLWSLRA